MLGYGAAVAAPTVVTPDVPTEVVATKVPLAPNFTAGATGLDPYRPWSLVTLDGLVYLANGWDQPKRWDEGSNFYDIGSTAPTTFAIALVAGSGTFANGTAHTYYLVFRNNNTGKETAPQQTAGVPGVSSTNNAGAGRDFRITWTDPGGEWTHARIYRRLQNSDTYKLVATVAAATATYDDTTTDANLTTAEGYVRTYRATLPPIFRGLAAYQARLVGWLGNALYPFQAVRIDDELRAEDLPDDNIYPVGAEDGTGDITAVLPHYGSATVFKRRAAFEWTGSDQATWAFRPLNRDRGALNPRCIVELEGAALVLDERGIYWHTPAGEPVVAGARTDTKESPLQPTWQRMNLSAADSFFAVHDKANRLVLFYVALDYEPLPNVAVVFDYGANRFVGIDTACWGTAAGYMEDTGGTQHFVRGCDLGYLWEDDYGAAQGVFAGSGRATPVTLTTATNSVLTASAASFDTTTADGVVGAPLERYSSAGVLLDLNRCVSASSTALTTYLCPLDTPAVGNLVAVGVIPAVAQTPRMTLRTPEKKWIRGLIVEHDEETDGDLRVDTATNGDAFALSREIDLSAGIRTPCRASNRGWTFALQVSQRYAGLGFAVRGVHVTYFVVPGQRS